MDRQVIVVWGLLLLGLCLVGGQRSEPWSYVCMSNETLPGFGLAPSLCQKMRHSPSQPFTTLGECNLICHKFGTLWPRPTGRVAFSPDLVTLDPSDIAVVFAQSPNLDPTVRRRTMAAVAVFKVANLYPLHPDYDFSGKNPFKPAFLGAFRWTIEFRIFENTSTLTMGTDESYSITARSGAIFITARNYFGARHALETLSQMMTYNDVTEELKMYRHADVTDQPVFQHRGLLIDTSRNFLSMNQIQRVLVGMSYNKMNVLHWHMTDSHSFPFKSEAVPEMSQFGAYSSRKVYKISEIAHLRRFAEDRGVRILLEIDSPAHMGNGWQWGPEKGLGNLALCANKEPWQDFCVEPPCGQINPLNDNVLDVLQKLYQELTTVLKPDMFHMGGDEVNINCWNSSVEFDQFFQRLKGADRTSKEPFLHVWGLFQQANLKQLRAAMDQVRVPVVYWTSDFTQNVTLMASYMNPQDYIIQVWGKSEGSEMLSMVKRGYRVIASHHDAWYLDCGFGSWVAEGNNWCSPYKGWQTVYDHNPRELVEQQARDEGIRSFEEIEQLKVRVIGGEVALWGEQTDGGNLDNKLWPRSAAAAERLWSDPKTNWEQAEFRMMIHRERLALRLHSVESLQPQWCLQNQGHCYDREHRMML